MDIVLDPEAQDIEDPFALDVRIVTDVNADDVAAPCDTSNGCPPTCASSCVSE